MCFLHHASAGARKSSPILCAYSMCINIYIHIYIYIHTQREREMSVGVCVHIYIFTYLHMCMYTHIQYRCIYIYISLSTYEYIRICMYTVYMKADCSFGLPAHASESRSLGPASGFPRGPHRGLQQRGAVGGVVGIPVSCAAGASFPNSFLVDNA